MITIVGGAYQGKTDFVKRELGIDEKDIADGASADFEAIKKAVCVKNYPELVRRLGDDCLRFTEELCRLNPDAVVVIDEIGCGIIPLEKSERVWRENVGRCGSLIAANSETVVRLVCGIPAVIKGRLK